MGCRPLPSVRRIRTGTLWLQDLWLPLLLRILRQEVRLGRARGQGRPLVDLWIRSWTPLRLCWIPLCLQPLRILRQEVCRCRGRAQALLLRRILRWLRPSLLWWIRIQGLLGINADPRHPDLVLATAD